MAIFSNVQNFFHRCSKKKTGLPLRNFLYGDEEHVAQVDTLLPQLFFRKENRGVCEHMDVLPD